MRKINFRKSILICITFSTVFFSCNKKSSNQYEENKTVTDSTFKTFPSSSAAIENGKDSTRKFIRTAELKFRVKNVIQSTYTIENTTKKFGGFVTYTNLTSEIDNVTNTNISSDSSLETTSYNVSNMISLRIPNTKLDSTLQEIAKNIDYLDYRIITAEDVNLQIIANHLTQKRAEKTEKRITNAIETKGKKLEETQKAEEVVVNKQEQADDAKIANLSLADQIKFSTINLTIYQRKTFKQELIPNEKSIDAYEPGLGSKLYQALKFGWDILEQIFIFIVNLWGLILFSVLAYFVYKKYKK